MHKRLFTGLFLSIAIAGLSGCPQTSGTSPGVWVFTVDTLEMALDLRPFGQTQEPDPLPGGVFFTFAGTVTWGQNGSAFGMTQVIEDEVFEFTGTVDSLAGMSGTWTQTAGGQSSGPWTAVKP